MGWRFVWVREWKRLVGQPKLLVFLLVLPVLYTALFGLLYTEHVVKHIPLVILDQSQTQVSRTVVNAFQDSEKFMILAQVADQAELEKYLNEKKAIAALVIPDSFTREIKRGQGSEVLVMVNGTNMLYSNTVLSAANEIIQTISAGTAMKSLEAMGQNPAQAQEKALPVQMRLRVLYNPTFNYTNFLLVGLIATALQQVILLTVALSMIEGRERMEELREVPFWKVVLGKALIYFAFGMVSLVLCLALAVGVFQVPFKGTAGPLLGLGAAFLFAVVFLGMVFSTICKDELTATQYSMLVALPSFLFSGFTWPVESMNGFGQSLSAALPLTYFVSDLRDLLLTGSAPRMMGDIYILLGFGAVLSVLSLGVFYYQKKRLLADGLGKKEVLKADLPG